MFLVNLILTLLIGNFLSVNGVQRSDYEQAPRGGNTYRGVLDKQEGAIRLVGGRNPYEGNIEVLHNNRWGAICDDEWDEIEGEIVCKQLGFPGLLRVTDSGFFGPAIRRYWMDNIYCEGNERELAHCRFDGWGISDCQPTEAAGVICLAPRDAIEPIVETRASPVRPAPPKAPIHYLERMDVRLRGSRLLNEGRVEVRFNGGRWGTICSDGWGLLEATVVCRQLGLGYARDAMQTDYFGGSNVSRTILSGTECWGNETTLSECLHHDPSLGDGNCHGPPTHVAVVVCDHLAPDLVVDFYELEATAHLEDRPMALMQCAMEENCVANEAYQIQRDDPNWGYIPRRLLKFSAGSLNAGNIDFRPIKDKSEWEWHMCHMHYHSMEVFATYDIIDLQGKKVAQGHKASFCLEDAVCMPGVERKYTCADVGDQGISVNCTDIYPYTIDCQWVDITDLEPGSYIFKVAVNPEFKVAEMSYENNAAVCNFLYTETYARVYNCHLQRP